MIILPLMTPPAFFRGGKPSSNVAAVGYDFVARRLFVQFKTGLYYYDAVPPAVFEAMRTADSIGRFVEKVIKPSYRVQKYVDVLAVTAAEVVCAADAALSER